MTPERWEQINRLFHEALTREPSERAAYLGRACAGDTPLRKEVESLLDSHELAGGFIETPASDLAAALLAGARPGLSTGQTVGRYKIVRLLAEGGMGKVYLARDMTVLKRNVAIKVLPPELAADPERMGRFVQEAETASSLNHPNILTVYEFGEVDSSRFIATEFVEGETLRRMMSPSRLTTREALDISIQIASALAAAHKAGVVHRDIKPENVMVREDGYVKVLDFGLAKQTLRPVAQANADSDAATDALVKTRPGVIMGTVLYMSPEQARALKVDARTDIWSLGVVLYEMVAGRAPFGGKTASDVLADVLTKEPATLSVTPERARERLNEIVRKALAKDLEERYQNVKDLLIDLKRLKQQLDVDAENERALPHEEADAPLETDAARAAVDTSGAHAPHTADHAGAHSTSSAEYVVSGIMRHKRGALVTLAALVAAVAAVAYFAYTRYATREGGGVSSVAVLPFQNLGGNPEAEYLSDGISESLINSLSRLPQLKVIARSSSFKYKGKEFDPQEVARALGVQAVVSGRVVQVGDNLQVSVELVKAEDRTQLWGEQYKRKASDLLAVQADISREIADALRLRLTSGEQQQLAKRETANPQAYELLLKGRYYDGRAAPGDSKKAVEYYEQAVAADQSYATAHAALASGYLGLVGGSAVDPNEYTPKAREEARKALELDEGLAEAHLAMAGLHQNAWEWDATEREFRRGIELNPSLAHAHLGYSHYLNIIGRYDEAVAEAMRARELSPLDLGTNTLVGAGLANARRYDEAITVLRKTLELEPGFTPAYSFLGYVYLGKGMYREAIAAFNERAKVGDLGTSDRVFLGTAYAGAGEQERAREILKQLETTKEYVSPAELAVLYTSLGESEKAIASLGRAYTQHDLQLQYLKVERGYDPLRSDPRFADLIRRVGLPL